MSKGGGSSAPAPTREERALASEQAAVLRQSRDLLSQQVGELDLFAPGLYERAGLRPTMETPEQVAARLAPLDSQIKAHKDRLQTLERGSHGTTYQRLTAELKEFERQRLEAVRPRISSLSPIPDENAPLREQIERGYYDRVLAAQRGELPVNPALLRQLEQEEMGLREMFRRNLGSGYEVSSPFLSAAGDFARYRTDTLEAARRNDLTGAQESALATQGAREQTLNQYLARIGGISALRTGNAQTLAGLAGNYAQAIQPLQQNRAMATQINSANDALRAQQQTAAGSAFVSSHLAAAAIAASLSSTAKVKKAIEPLDKYENESLKKLKDTPVMRWKYTWEDDTKAPHVGPILEMSPAEFRHRENPDMLSVVDYLGTTHAAVKALDRKVERLRDLVSR